MDFEFSDEQEQLRSTARSLLSQYCSSERIRRAIVSAHPFDRELWARMTELGWFALSSVLAQEGAGSGFVEVAMLLEEIGRALAPVPYLPTLLAVWALEKAGEESLVDDLASGRKVGAAVWDGQLGVGAPDADVVVRGSDDGVSLLVAPEVVAEPAMDLTRTVGWVPEGGRRIGSGAEARDLLDRAAVGTSAMLLGGAARVLEMTTAYAMDRRQFGRPIGSFQAVKHHCADMLVDVEAMRSVLYWAAWCVDVGHPDASLAASSAKAWCAQAGPRVIATGLQVHGGIGFTWDHDLHLFLKRANLDQVSFGGSRLHQDRAAGLLTARIRTGNRLI
jgi:alkylation response protein AidB-like acyl-CoA dehydrogenase